MAQGDLACPKIETQFLWCTPRTGSRLTGGVVRRAGDPAVSE